ncbi:SDR family oxidoreductase [Gordonia jinhuaensis]|uniref:Short-chain dehydrogenase n=2 Tax=Gordonia jinhuaensis TaxID=1517702 RepID=A0A916WWH3_9ACTN|nr:SDR family oxidoreductase [Gordonia jinhuaensis]GGB35436.1 short-chain dehydrogenase [Gordonia jinhuaensis]
MVMTAQNVFITGAAAGIGRATALSLSKLGYTVGAFDIDEAGLTSLAEEIERSGGKVRTGHLDVRDADEFATRVTEFAEADGGKLNVLINNAGVLESGPFEDIDVAKHHREIDINTKGVVNGCHAAFPYLRATKGATVVNLASASAIYGQADLANYSATKFFVRGLTEALNIEWADRDIRVVAIWPLFVQSAMTATLKTGTTDSLGINLGPQDVADVIVTAVRPGVVNKAVNQVHYTVGRDTAVLAAGSRFSPVWLTRLVNKRLAHH